MTEMRCRIFKKTNLIEERFASANPDDWAAMCVFDGKIQPVVLWGGKTQCDSRPSPARDYKELLSDPLHDANLGAADVKRIAVLHDAFGGTGEVPPITHAGPKVGDERASVIYYCRSYESFVDRCSGGRREHSPNGILAATHLRRLTQGGPCL